MVYTVALIRSPYKFTVRIRINFANLGEEITY